jgi:hypothetical protein
MQQRDALGYEKRDANWKGIFYSVAGLFAVLILVDVVVHFIIKDFEKSPRPADQYSGSVRSDAARAMQSPYPKLQVSPPADLAHFREEETTALTTYGWVDQQKGIVRVPIDRAMDLVLQRGLPARQPGEHGKAGASSYELQQQRPNAKQPEIGGQP